MNRKTIFSLFILLLIGACFTGCNNSGDSITSPISNDKFIPGTNYDITLESVTQVSDGWEWVWKIVNTNPGNGGGGTTQNLSHWDFIACFPVTDIVSAAIKTEGGEWIANTSIVIEPDNSQQCYTGDVFKFDYGTSGTTPSYYKIVLNKNYGIDTSAVLVYKSGNVTGCGTGTFDGIDCTIIPPDTTCETAFAYEAGTSICFLDEGFSRWGWTIGQLNVGAGYTFDLYAAAGQCDLTKGTLVGSVTFNYINGGNSTIVFNLNEGFSLNEAQVYVGSEKFPVKKGVPTVAPCQYPFNISNPVSGTVYELGTYTGPVYLIAHAVVCGEFD